MSRQGRSTKDKIETVDWILTLNEVLTMDRMKYLKIELGMNEMLKNRLNEILNFSQNMTFHPVHTYLPCMRCYQFCPLQPPLGSCYGPKEWAHFLWLLTQSYTAVCNNIRRQAKMLYVWYPKNRTDLKVIHEENDVIEMGEFVQ